MLIKELGWYWRSSIGAPLPCCPSHQLLVGSRCLTHPLFALSVLSGVLLPLLGQIPGRLGRVPCSSNRSAWWLLHISLPTPASTEQGNSVCLSAFGALLGLVESCNKPSDGFRFGSSHCSGAPRCCLVSSARSRAALLTPLSILCLSAAFTREGMPVSTFLRLIPPFAPFPCLLPSHWLFCCCCETRLGHGLLRVNISLCVGDLDTS